MQQLEEKNRIAEELRVENAKLSIDLENEKKNAAENIKMLQESEVRLKMEFENLANKIFEEKGRAISEKNKEVLTAILTPLKEQMDTFRSRIDEVHKTDIQHSAQLLEQVRLLRELSNKVSDDANNLAKAITGDSKRQGDWGELIIERLFEISGLTPEREYDRQKGHRTDQGSLQKPDFVVYLPGERAVIVDSKVSLTDFARFNAAENEVAQKNALTEHVNSVRRHIKDLRSKNYEDLLGNKTLDFVIMCIPLEPAYQAALQADPELLYDLAQTNVVICGPTTLMITLKLIAQIWRREHENRNAEQIADRAGRLYNQVALVYEAMLDASKKLGGTAEAVDLALKRLWTGRGNLVRRVEEMRQLGAKVNKQLPQDLLERAIGYDDAELSDDETKIIGAGSDLDGDLPED
ncbi:MAG: DNA recombination protein RmuC [Lentisphaerae bacterium]|nr:DNA recombination protein RmuC [Lentisphaerota bacterium]